MLFSEKDVSEIIEEAYQHLIWNGIFNHVFVELSSPIRNFYSQCGVIVESKEGLKIKAV